MTRSKPRPPLPLRLWPGVLAGALLLVLRLVVPAVAPEAAIFGVLGGVFCALAVLIWWVFFSRAPRLERWGAVAVAVAALAATPAILHESIRTGMMGLTFYVYAVPATSLALVAWASACRGLTAGPRRATLVAAVVLSCGAFALLRTDGILGAGGSQFAWRWSPTAEQRLLASAVDPSRPIEESPVADRLPDQVRPDRPALSAEPASTPRSPEAPRDWPGFRGPRRDGRVAELRVDADWSRSPPREIWRRSVGPAWSSFAIAGNRLYTQEQRGEDEIVSCYDLATGRPIWMHRDENRFWESNAGAGPRATPTLGDGRVYALGPTGILNVLDARDGRLIWMRNAALDASQDVPYWGFAGSPLLLDELVVIALSGRLAAYDRSSGEPRWIGPDGGDSYSSPSRMMIDGIAQIVFASGGSVAGFAPIGGGPLWERAWEGAAILQPARISDRDIVFATAGGAGGLGLQRIAVAPGSDSPVDPGAGWTTEALWTSTGLKPYFNDFVIHEGHAYGFDGRILACIDLADGKRQWKGGRYGNGQLILLEAQDALLALSEEGELGLVAATPETFREIARLRVLEGKTWNHPAVAGDVLLVRNDREMTAYRLPLAKP